MTTSIKYLLFKLAAILSVLQLISCSTKESKNPALIPLPQKLEWNKQNFDLADSSTAFIQRLVPQIEEVPFNEEEAYKLIVTNDSVLLEATTAKGLFWGQQTIKQLSYTKKNGRYLTGCFIVDWPAFKVRGFMQDVGRNYQSINMLKEQIDVLAAYKMNVFHLHLTDNPGWRLESKIYPQLNSPQSMSRKPGKYYTQEEFIDLANYCNQKNITLLPEFDVPGHSQAFRKALRIESMRDPLVEKVLTDLIDELCSLVPAEQMPYIHLGTDEVWHEYERPNPDLLSKLINKVESHGRKVIVWRPGIAIKNDTSSITQLWSSAGAPKPGHPYLDSRLNYLNHLDPLAGIPQLYFDRISGAAHGDSLRLGGILCCWNDNNVNNEYDILRQNPVYPGILTYSETSWTGQKKDIGENYLAKLPEKGRQLFNEFIAFENRLIEHRNKYFREKPFPYVRQTNMEWSIIGPFDHKGNVTQKFAVEDSIHEKYEADSVEYNWTEGITGGTIHLQHFFGYPSYFPKANGTYYAFTRIWFPKAQKLGVWIGFHDWSRSGGRRGGPFPEQGKWHNTDPKVWVNKQQINAPTWQQPGLESNSEEIPFTDENYSFREPTYINFEKGWNEVLLKIPLTEKTWKRMFTFVPLAGSNGNFQEVEQLKYNSEITLKTNK
ncbi:family 20 glycosylhydrolase [Draconibacterium sediminis]|uniref:family 20 glycosylhydrolase n=1 Tax=Draconibacterium sediminis TaxID=1544798 RepID=UPI0026F00BE4|nr:family 20 glycosylhydrolase [Draconibacterium sediminis]